MSSKLFGTNGHTHELRVPATPRRHGGMAIATGVILLAMTAAAPAEWLHYGGDAGGRHYSELQQITPANVGTLQQAWSYSTGEVAARPDRAAMSSFNGTPIILPEAAGRSLVFCSAFNRIIALDPATGAERWVYDPVIDLENPDNKYLCRGVAYGENLEVAGDQACRHSLYLGTQDLRLVAVDALSGQPCTDFGSNGAIDLRAEISGRVPDLRPGDVQFSAPPVVVAGSVILGSSDNTKFWRSDNPSGAVRAFDSRTGGLRWRFDPAPRNPGDPMASQWDAAALRTTGGGNVWTLMSVDTARGLVFLPTSTAGPNYYGGNRPGDNRYANSVVALDAATGNVVWHYQIVHHDVWDLDLPAQPILADIRHNGSVIPVVIQLTKQGLVFVLHRETGEPVFPVEERPVPTDGVDGERLSPTQPFPLLPAPLVEIGIEPADAWGFFSMHRNHCRQAISQYRRGGLYEPPDLQGRVAMPGLSVNNWGGGAYDPDSNLLVLPVNRSPMFLRLWVTAEIPPEVMNKPRMGPLGPPMPIDGTPYSYEMGPLLSPIMTPCTAPPWGELLALDMDSGQQVWRRSLGTIEKLARMPLPLEWGTPLAGGPTSTASGITFIGATADEKFRAFNTRTGELLWQAPLPTAGMATPMTYEHDGRQYVVLAAGGHMFMYSQKIGDSIVAFALPATGR